MFILTLLFSVVEAPVMVSVSGEGSGVAGTSYSLTCTVRLPLGVAQFLLNIQWKRPDMTFMLLSQPQLLQDFWVLYSFPHSSHQMQENISVRLAIPWAATLLHLSMALSLLM